VTVETWTLRETPKLNSEQFLRWQALLESRTGIQITEARKSFLETSLTLRMREVGADDYDAYYDTLMAGLAGEMEWSTLVDRLSVQETSFFRHTSSYRLVRQYVTSLLDNDPSRRQIELWSVGCATGEEPYSLAMLMDGLLAERGDTRYYGVTGTDLSMPALAKAREGVYQERRLAGLDAAVRERYFEPAGNGRLRIAPGLKQKVCFARLNMLQLHEAPLKNVDIIYCQNVLIYFKRWRKQEIVNQLVEFLSPTGMLVLGVGELMEWTNPLIERVPHDDTLAFVRKGALTHLRGLN
jgi:chemotaxis protein methyltransferase CheR/type IV pilus assembly protein PilK